MDGSSLELVSVSGFCTCIRLQMAGLWDETAKLYTIIANRGHPTAQIHLGKQYVHGNGVSQSYVEAYKWFALSDTSIGNHFIELITEDMSINEINEAYKI